MKTIKKVFSLLMALAIMLTSASISVFAENLDNYDKNQLTTYLFDSKAHTFSLNVTSDSVLDYYLTCPIRIVSNDTAYYQSAEFIVLNSNNTQVYKDDYVYDATNTTMHYSVYLPKGTYTISVDLNTYYTDYIYGYTYKYTLTPTTLYGKSNPVQNGKLINYKYLSKDNISYLSLNENSKVTLYSTIPQDKDGENQSFYAIITNSNGTKVYEKFHVSGSTTAFEDSVYLSKGNYTINYQITYGADYGYDNIVSSYKTTVTPLSKVKYPTPKLSSTSTSYGYGYYNLKFTWQDNTEYYDGIELYTKTNSGKWTLTKTVTNSKYYRNYGFTTTYNSGSIVYYKVRAYKQCEGGFKWYSAYSNVITLKKLEKPTISVKSGKKFAKVTVTKKAPNATGYEIYRSTKKSSGYKKVKTTKSLTFNNKKLKSKKTYYYKVRAYKSVSGSKMYSVYTKPVKVKVK